MCLPFVSREYIRCANFKGVSGTLMLLPRLSGDKESSSGAVGKAHRTRKSFAAFFSMFYH